LGIYILVLDSACGFSRTIFFERAKRVEKIAVIPRRVIKISYQNSNTGYESPETKGLIKSRDNKGMKIRDDNALEFLFSMI